MEEGQDDEVAVVTTQPQVTGDDVSGVQVRRVGHRDTLWAAGSAGGVHDGRERAAVGATEVD